MIQATEGRELGRRLGGAAWALPALATTVVVALAGCGDDGPADPGSLLVEDAVLEAVGDSVDLTAVVGRSGAALLWTSLDPHIVSVTGTGRARALASGEARVRVRSGPRTADGTVTVLPDAEVRIQEATLEPDGERYRLTLRLVNEGGRGFYRLGVYRRGEDGLPAPVLVDVTDLPAAVGLSVTFRTWFDAPAGGARPADVVIVRSRAANGEVLRLTECVRLSEELACPTM